jgi:3-deoxy-D-manno-octulosonic acid kinase
VKTSTQTDPEALDAEARVAASGNGAMIWDAALDDEPTAQWFDVDWWRGRQRLRAMPGGRGGVTLLEAPGGACVLRHYHRGGWMTPLLGDRYLWTGHDATRSFAEFRLLAALRRRGLPVPAPVAARYVRRWPYYRADLITRLVEGAQTLAEVVRAGALDAALAERVGRLVARFHAQGVDHADLNAHNVLLAADALWLIDFDRGEIRAGGTAWKLANLARLKRSLLKVGACNRDALRLDHEIWRPLMHGYEQGL